MSTRNLELSFALSNNGRTRPLIEGKVEIEGIDPIPTRLHPSEMFWRQLRFKEFDVSEMSMSSLLIAWANGDRTWTALPIFTTRHFFHTWALVRGDSDITCPADLRGKRVGVPEYQQTAAIWSRGALQHEFGVLPQEINWFMERGPDRSHGAATAFNPPEGVSVAAIPPTTDIGRMMLDGELDATLLHLNGGNLVDRSAVDLAGSGVIRQLFPDAVAEGRRYYGKTGLYPINHAVVVRTSLLERHPWIALNLFTAFQKAKAMLLAVGSEALRSHIDTGTLCAGTSPNLLDLDPAPYGGARNRALLETVATYVHEQGLTKAVVPIDEVFAQSTLEL